MTTFTHLNVASAFSAHHGTARPEALVAAQAAFGARAAGIADRDGLYGAVRHIRACLAQGIAPIVGVSLAVLEKDGRAAGRITVLAHGHTDGSGWATLARSISAAHAPRGKRAVGLLRDRIGHLLRGADGATVTVLLGHDSDVGQAVATGDLPRARVCLSWWKGILPDSLAVEVVCHYTEPGEPASLRHAAQMLELAEAQDVTAVLGNAVRYLEPDDALTGDVLDAASHLSALGAFTPQPNGQAWLKTPDDMHALARRIVQFSTLPASTAPRLIASTEHVGERCTLDPDEDLGWRRAKIPENEVIGLTGDPNAVLWSTAEAGISERFPYADTAELTRVRTRMRDELVTINEFGFASYFLTVADVTSMMRGMGIRNQARGSGAGSLVNYLLHISNVDPLEHDLLFERFLGNKRETLPDIDIDVESARRHEIYRAIFERYGSTRVSLMAMQNTYRARGAARDAGAALGLTEDQITFVAKNIWRFNARDFRDALGRKPELREFAELLHTDDKLDMLVDLTERLDRLPRHVSMHPCGVILGNNDLYNLTPVQPSGMGLPMSQFDKDDIDDVGLLKLDVLGVRMQSSIAYTVSEIRRLHGSRVALAGNLPLDAPYINPDGHLDVDSIPHDDEATYESIRTAHTLGMFQIESPGQRELIGKMQPTEYNDLIADISLFRPGPMKGNMVAPFLDAKHGFTMPNYLHSRFRYFLGDSYGVVIYHEHILRMLHECMGVSLAEADELRRSMEKNTDSIETNFRTRTAANKDSVTGKRLFTDADIERIWLVLKGFGSFGFCKAHGAAFALPTYQSAWLKAHYPAEFLAGILTHDPGMYPRRLLLAEVRRMGIPILALDVNKSDGCYRVERQAPQAPNQAVDGTLGIRLSLRDVQGINEKELQRILLGQPFDSLTDFFERAKPSRSLLQRLALVGALDDIAATSIFGDGTAAGEPPPTRGDVIARVRQLTAANRRVHFPENQLDFTVDDRHLIPRGNAEFTSEERVHAELSILNMDATAHVLESYRPLLDELGVTPANELLGLWNKTEVLVAGIRVATQTPPMKSGKRVVFISLDDGTGCSDSTFFEEAQEATGPVLFGTRLMVIRGRTRRTGERGISIEASNAWDLRELWTQFGSPRRK
ncbi:DNA polymerase III subunit alpha [Alpinimonas psychrophila]|uniref:DNA-directed DNA polymerase n=1 Tax=Alpinimonas psychrophila TaxID=748908 RepID=A0A7W3JSY1_9MICO|nr:DNA polymerase III subunit alpha [Alpinimonas psychrophila]MBA8828651.1 error-prone DNA polymerase [Alpinimonas psychrophila]